MPRPPARLLGVPRILLDHAIRQTDGDFSRIRLESDGSLLILNQAPQAIPTEKPPAPVIPAGQRPAAKRAAPATKPPAKKAATKPAIPRTTRPPSRARVAKPLPASEVVELNRDPVAPETTPKVYEQKLVPRPTTTSPKELPKHLQPDPVRVHRTRPTPEPVKVAEPPKVATQENLKDRITAVERGPEKAYRLTDKSVPAEFDIKQAWEQLDVEQVATSILNACRAGLPEVMPLDMHPEVLALDGINFDLVATSVRNPHYVEIAGAETVTKGYPVLRFFRGDITTVVGLRDTFLPTVIATYAHSRLDADIHRVGFMKGGGGGARKTKGLPSTPALVAKRLRQMGAEVAVDERSTSPVDVMYRGQNLGKISQQGSKTQCESDYQRMVRKMEAIARRS